MPPSLPVGLMLTVTEVLQTINSILLLLEVIFLGHQPLKLQMMLHTLAEHAIILTYQLIKFIPQMLYPIYSFE